VLAGRGWLIHGIVAPDQKRDLFALTTAIGLQNRLTARDLLSILPRLIGRKSRAHQRIRLMAKSNTVQIKLVSTADTGFFYVTKKNARAQTTKLELNKYDPVVRKHVPFKEAKIK
jgi:large subunit ribosomal protein L33